MGESSVVSPCCCDYGVMQRAALSRREKKMVERLRVHGTPVSMDMMFLVSKRKCGEDDAMPRGRVGEPLRWVGRKEKNQHKSRPAVSSDR